MGQKSLQSSVHTQGHRMCSTNKEEMDVPCVVTNKSVIAPRMLTHRRIRQMTSPLKHLLPQLPQGTVVADVNLTEDN